jgi:hypothetical protein
LTGDGRGRRDRGGEVAVLLGHRHVGEGGSDVLVAPAPEYHFGTLPGDDDGGRRRGDLLCERLRACEPCLAARVGDGHARARVEDDDRLLDGLRAGDGDVRRGERERDGDYHQRLDQQQEVPAEPLERGVVGSGLLASHEELERRQPQPRRLRAHQVEENERDQGGEGGQAERGEEDVRESCHHSLQRVAG